MQIINIFGENILFALLKQTKLVGYENAKVYEKSEFSLIEGIDPTLLVPTQRYVLESQLKAITSLEVFLNTQKHSLYSLKGGIHFKDDEGKSMHLLPPIVEDTTDQDGNQILLISDGMHRIFSARKLGKKINIIFVQNVQFPYYAMPLSGGWNDVLEFKQLPENFPKKVYRELMYKDLFRNYNEIFPGIQQKR